MGVASPQIVYTPDAVIDIVAESLKPTLPVTPFLMKGLYKQTNTTLYDGYYYGRLHSTTGGYEITVRVPEKIQPAPMNGEHYVFSGYLTKRPKKKGHVDLIFSVTAVEGREPQEFTRIISIYQQKARRGYRDVAALIRHKIISGERLRIVRLYGNNAIVDKDVEAVLNQTEPEIVECYDFTDCRVSMGSPSDIEKELQKLDQEEYDLIALLRGGGSNLSVFDDLTLVTAASALKTPLVTGIGHEVDKPLIQEIADRSYSTPSAFGYFLRDIAITALTERGQIECKKAQQLDDLNRLRQQTQQLDQTKRELEKQIEQERTQANQTEQKLAGLADELDRTNQQLQSQLTAHVTKLNELNRVIEAKSAHVVEQAAQIAKLDDALTVNRQEVSQHLIRIAELEQEIGRLQLSSEHNQVQAAQLQRSLSDENALLRNTVRELSVQVTELQATSQNKQLRFNRLVWAGATLLVLIVVIYLFQAGFVPLLLNGVQ